MYVQVQNRTKFLDLHLATCLKDWDMSEEIKLTTTTDQLCQAPVYTIQSIKVFVKKSRRSVLALSATSRSFLNITSLVFLCLRSRLLCSVYTLQRDKIYNFAGPHCLQIAVFTVVQLSTDHFHCVFEHRLKVIVFFFPHNCLKNIQDLPAPQKPKAAKERGRRTGLAQSKRLQRILQESCNLKSGCWPRPPVNYCILIAMALSSSRAGSLNVQQIYNFTREHFPFFQTAPDGWKNTIRHNLCFSNSFEKTPQLVCSQGKRKSCLWHLTADGRRRLRNEIHLLTGDSIAVLERSMTNPGGMIRTLFEL
uniref:Forkhead box R1 n=1 Tax=Lepisosteus oculatus TaxID=7918 RepID=W5M5Z4_LEPOC